MLNNIKHSIFNRRQTSYVLMVLGIALLSLSIFSSKNREGVFAADIAVHGINTFKNNSDSKTPSNNQDNNMNFVDKSTPKPDYKKTKPHKSPKPTPTSSAKATPTTISSPTPTTTPTPTSSPTPAATSTPTPAGSTWTEMTFANWYLNTPDIDTITNSFDATGYSYLQFYWDCDSELYLQHSNDQSTWTTQFTVTQEQCQATGMQTLEVVGNYYRVLIQGIPGATEHFVFAQGRFFE